jgi:hypothetical protein
MVLEPIKNIKKDRFDQIEEEIEKILRTKNDLELPEFWPN